MPFLLKNGPKSNKVEKGDILPLKEMVLQVFSVLIMDYFIKYIEVIVNNKHTKGHANLMY